MKAENEGKLSQLIHGQDGQVLPVMALMLVALLAMTAVVVDLGHALFAYRELQAASDAAALAGADTLPNALAPVVATSYSAIPGGLNYHSNLNGVTIVAGYPQLRCLATLQAQGEACVAPTNANAVTVKEQVTVPMYFTRVFGRSSMTLTAISTAAMGGAQPKPYNVMIVLDSTASMNSYDSDSTCTGTRISCALQGVRILLATLSPCGSGLTTCGSATDGNVSNAVDSVSVMTFPGVSSTADAQSDYNCLGKKPSISPYSYPTLPQYSIVGFSSDYRGSDTATALTSGSNLVAAVGGKSACSGIQAIGGEGTYYAGVIYAAQAALQAQSAINNAPNVMVLLSDGDANASSKAMPGASTSSGTYPSTKNQCAQAVTAAQSAVAEGTTIYTVAYGANSSGCSTDTSGITPCQVMQRIASAPQNFYSDYTSSSGDGSCISAAQGTTGLVGIFQAIGNSLGAARLIQDNMT